MSDDQSVTGVREALQLTSRQCGGQLLGFGWWDSGILLTLEDPNVRGELDQSKTPRPPFQHSIPGVRVDPLLHRFTDGVEVQTSDCRITKQTDVRFWAR